MIWTKFQIFDCSREISNLYSDWLLLLKVYKASSKKIWRNYVSWHWRVMQNLKKNWFVVSKMIRIWWILTWALKILKISTLIDSLCAKYITFDLKSTDELCFMTMKSDANFKKNWPVAWKMTWGNGQIFTVALESLKIGTLMGFLYPKEKMYELKIYRGVMRHDNKEWNKIWKRIDLSFLNWLKAFDEFWPEEKFAL